MMQALPTPTVSHEWLDEHLESAQLRIVDASWYLPTDNRDPAAEFNAQHIPGAVFFDIDVICDQASELPHMAPDADSFAAAAGALGIGSDDCVVVYDTAGLFSAARVWWLFRLMGMTSVAVLNGGLPAWLREGRATQSGGVTAVPRKFVARMRPGDVRARHEVAAALAGATAQIVDARPAARFAGAAPEPRSEVPSGHMRGAKHVFFKSVLTPTGALLPTDELRTIFTNAGVDLARPIITSCGSGVTAAVLSLALEALAHPNHALYDGSWSEWATTAGCEIVEDG